MDEVRTTATNFFVTLTFIVFGGPGIVGVYVPAWITRWKIPHDVTSFHRLLALLLIILGLLPLGESIIRFVRRGRGTLSPTHPTETLVVSGFYQHVRNPMYLGVLTLLIGQGLLFESQALWEYVVWVAIGFHLFVIFYEEPTLRRRYGGAYEDFCANVPRWLPRLRPWSGDTERESKRPFSAAPR